MASLDPNLMTIALLDRQYVFLDLRDVEGLSKNLRPLSETTFSLSVSAIKIDNNSWKSEVVLTEGEKMSQVKQYPAVQKGLEVHQNGILTGTDAPENFIDKNHM